MTTATLPGLATRPPYTVGTALVPRTTPPGPRECRIAWAEAAGQLRVVMHERDGLVEFADALGRLRVSRDAVDDEYERA